MLIFKVVNYCLQDIVCSWFFQTSIMWMIKSDVKCIGQEDGIVAEGK